MKVERDVKTDAMKVERNVKTDEDVDIEELHILTWWGRNRAYIRSIPHDKLRHIPVVSIDGHTYVQNGIDDDGRLIFEEIDL